MSKSFVTCYGVRQRGILTPVLFNIYVDRLSASLNNLYMGCLFNGKVINHLMYADGIVLFSPSVKGLQQLVDSCCNFGETNVIILMNARLCVCIY